MDESLQVVLGMVVVGLFVWRIAVARKSGTGVRGFFGGTSGASGPSKGSDRKKMQK